MQAHLAAHCIRVDPPSLRRVNATAVGAARFTRHTPAGGMVGHAAGYFLVFFGGGLGAMLRHFVNLVCARVFGTAFPWGTFIINITGSTVMGLIAGYLAFKGRGVAALAAVHHDRHPRRLHHVLPRSRSMPPLLYERGAPRRLPRSMCSDRSRSRSPACSPSLALVRHFDLSASRWRMGVPELRMGMRSFRLLRFCCRD